jgi:hypothetical protein
MNWPMNIDFQEYLKRINAVQIAPGVTVVPAKPRYRIYYRNPSWVVAMATRGLLPPAGTWRLIEIMVDTYWYTGETSVYVLAVRLPLTLDKG